MSFILDALKKSETDRQQQGSAEFANVPVSSGRDGAPRWLWVLGALLLVNLVVLVGLLTRSSGPPAIVNGTVSMPLETEQIQPAEPATEPFAEQVAAARLNAPPREEPAVVEETASETPAPRPAPTSAPAVNALALPTFHDVVATGSVTLPELHWCRAI